MRVSTPFHPEGNSLVERFNKTLKRMLNVLVNSDNPRDWDRQLPFLLWAYRELPNDTVGLSPFELVYGRQMRGPLAILKGSWDESDYVCPPTNLSVVDYMNKLKENLIY